MGRQGHERHGAGWAHDQHKMIPLRSGRYGIFWSSHEISAINVCASRIGVRLAYQSSISNSATIWNALTISAIKEGCCITYSTMRRLPALYTLDTAVPRDTSSSNQSCTSAISPTTESPAPLPATTLMVDQFPSCISRYLVLCFSHVRYIPYVLWASCVWYMPYDLSLRVMLAVSGA
jgi:hypothetical protein